MSKTTKTKTIGKFEINTHSVTTEKVSPDDVESLKKFAKKEGFHFISPFAPMSEEEVLTAEACELFHELTNEWPARLGFREATASVIGIALVRLRHQIRRQDVTEKEAKDALTWAENYMAKSCPDMEPS